MSTMMTPRGRGESLDRMSFAELQREYCRQKRRNARLTEEEAAVKRKIEQLREDSVQFQLRAETEQEYATMQLLRRVDDEEKTAAQYLAYLQEEEQATEELQRRIDEVRRERNEVQNTIEQKQEYQLLQLQDKLMETAEKKSAVEKQLMDERQQYLDLLGQALVLLRGQESAQDGALSGNASCTAADAAILEALRPKEADGSASSSSHSLNVTPAPASAKSHMEIAALQGKLNKLLAEQASAMQKFIESEARTRELSTQLKEQQQEAVIYRNKAAKCKEDLQKSRLELQHLKETEGSVLDASYNSMRSASEAMQSSLRDRTKGLLSSTGS